LRSELTYTAIEITGSNIIKPQTLTEDSKFL
jgi:hypothetical protein